ncbi:MAG: ABC transporter ATP-binding protein [Ignavibacteria bacterium]|nr:ABC transporter ATP-binding protein [Ignavibacteria bacterium]
MEEKKNILEIKNLNVEYSSSEIFTKNKYYCALDNLSLNIPAGIAIGIVGESGSGKSTLARALVRLLDIFNYNVKVSGEILFYTVDNVTDINKAKAKQLKKIRKEIQIIFQDPASSLSPKMTARELISEPLCNYFNLSNKEVSQKLSEWLELTGLGNIDADSYPRQLSGGQRQKVAIARSLAARPSVLIADEIVSALDVSVQGQILNLISDLKSKFNLTLIFISHDLSVVRNISDYVVVMNEGKIVEEGNTDEIFNNPQNDYTKKLLSSIPLVKFPH